MGSYGPTVAASTERQTHTQHTPYLGIHRVTFASVVILIFHRQRNTLKPRCCIIASFPAAVLMYHFLEVHCKADALVNLTAVMVVLQSVKADMDRPNAPIAAMSAMCLLLRISPRFAGFWKECWQRLPAAWWVVSIDSSYSAHQDMHLPLILLGKVSSRGWQ